MAFDVRDKYRKNHNITSGNMLTQDIGLSLDRDMERDARLKAIEKARRETNNSFNMKTNDIGFNNINAGNDRTTALRQPQQNIQGNAILPTYSGLNIAANGANVNTDFKTEAATKNGWKGLIGSKSQEQTISKEQSLAHANEVYAPYKDNQEVTDLLKQYVSTNDDLENLRMHGASADQKYHYVREKQKLEKEIRNITGLSKDDFNQIAENYTYLRHDEERKAQQEKLDNASGIEKAALTGLNVATSAIGNYQSAVGLLKKPNDPELGRDYNSVTSYWSNLSRDTKEVVHTDIDESTMADYQKALAGFGYDAFTMGAESAASQLLGGAGLASFFAGGYASSLEEAEQRGLTKGQAQGYALVSGGLEYATEKIPFDNLKNIFKGKAVSKEAVKGSLMPYVKALFKQAKEEATEEVINGVGDILADALINSDKSKINIAIQNYMQEEGLSEEEATRKAFFEEGKDILYAAASAAVSAGASAGPALTVQAYETTKAGRNIADYENKTGNLTRNVENENYIPETRENYVADEDYRQAQETRQAILAASEKAAKGERISGREARALAESYRQTANNLRTAQKVEGSKLIEGARAKAEEKAIEQIKEASTPAEVETIKEENINSEAVQAAVAEKKAEMIEAGKATEAEFTEAITPTKAAAMAESGETIEQEVLEQLPEKVQQAYETGKASQANKLTSDVSKMDISTIEYANSEGKKIHADIKSVSENESGEIVFNLSNGETVKAAEVEYTPNGRQLYNSPNGINSLDNPTLIQLAIDIERNSKHGVAVGNVTLALKDMYTMGAAGLDFDQAIKSRDFDLKTLGKDNLRAAYEEGKKNSTATSRATVAKRGKGLIREATEENAADYKSQFADEATRNEYENQLSESNKKFLELFSRKIGVDIAFFNENSQDRGSYRPDEGKIYLNLYHSHNMFNVALHEGIGEFMAASNEKAYNSIVDSVLNAYAATNSTKLAKDIRAYQAAYEGDTYGGTYRGAAQELFNDALSDMFSSEENMHKLYNWMVENEGEKQANKVKKTLADYFKSVAETIKEVITEGRLSKAEERQLRISEKEANTYVDQILRAMDVAIANRDAGAETYNNMINEIKSLGYDGVIFDDKDVKKYSVQYVAFNPEQIKETTNLNPTRESKDIRYSISVGEDRVHTYKGIEIVQNPTNKEYQQMRADIIKERPWMDGPDTILLRHTYDEEGNEYYWDAYAGMHFEIEPIIAEHWKTRVNQQWEWWKDDDKDFWANRSFRRYSKAVFGEESQYSSQIEQTQFVSQILSTLNNQLKGTSVSPKYIEETVKYILDKYDADLNPDDFKMELSQFIAYMTANEQVDYNQMMNYLLNIGDEVIQASQLKDPEEERIYSELKKELSGHKISLTDQERKELISKYGGNWNAVFGKLNAAGIKLNNAGKHMDGSTYSEIVDKFREIAGVSLDEETTAVDQIATILDAMEALKPSAYQWEGATDMDKALDVATTIIDRYYSMATAIKESNIVKGTEKGAAAVERAKKNEIKKLRAKQQEYKAKVNEEFQQLVEDRKKVIQEQQEFYKRQAEIEKNFRGEKKAYEKKVSLSNKEIEKTARLQAQVQYQGLKDTEAKKKNKDNIVRTCMRLINWMNKPTDTRHVPTFLKPALTDMIKSINFMPASMRKGDDGTISAMKWQESMRKLQQVIQGITSASADSLNDSEKYALALVMEVDEIVYKMQQLLDKYGGTADVSRMKPEDLKVLSDIMTSISRSISKMNENFMNRRFQHVSEAAQAAMNEMSELKPMASTKGAVGDFTEDFLNLSMAEPITFFEELGSASESIMQEFFDGEKIGIEIIEEADDFFQKTANDLELTTKEIRSWENDVKDYTIDGVTISLTSADLMSLYCSYNREMLDQEERPFEATHHIAAGGIKGFRRKIVTKKGVKIVNRNPEVAHVNQAEVLRLLDNLTETQKKYADLIVGYMSTTLAENGNKTSNKLNGYSKFLGKYYFPLKTDTNAIATNESNNTSGMAKFLSLVFPSFTKSQVDKADNALVIMNFFDVVTEHIKGMSNYCAYAMPISDAMRWYNYAETERANTDEENQYFRTTRSVKGSMDRVHGDKARNYFEDFIRDVNLDTAITGDKNAQVIQQALTGFAKAKAVGLNVRVIVQQPCAIIRAEDVIEKKYLLKGWFKMMQHPFKACDYAQSNNYLCYWKSKGFSDTRVSQGLKEIITGLASKRQDIVEKTGFLAGWADDITWASMYYAAEEKVKEATDLKEGTDEFHAAVEEVFSNIINHTQVIDSNLRKTATMRSQRELTMLANAFKKEPQKTYNMLHRSKWNQIQAKYSGDPDKIKEANKRWHHSIMVFLENAVITAIAQSFVDAWRDDDDEDEYLTKMIHKMIPYESYEAIQAFIEELNKNPEDRKNKYKMVASLITGVYGGLGNAADNMNPFSWMPFISDVNSLLQGYQVSRLDDTAALKQLKDSIDKLSSSTATTYSKMYAASQVVGYFTGIGADNALKDIRGLYNQFLSDKTGYRIEKTTTAEKQNAKKKEQRDFSAIYETNDTSSIKKAMNDIHDKAIESGKAEKDAWNAVRDALEAEYKKQIAEHPENLAAINNRFTTLLEYTKYENGTRTMSDKEIKNKLDSWSKSE